MRQSVEVSNSYQNFIIDLNEVFIRMFEMKFDGFFNTSLKFYADEKDFAQRKMYIRKKNDAFLIQFLQYFLKINFFDIRIWCLCKVLKNHKRKLINSQQYTKFNQSFLL